jgi:serine/threonine protein kinase
MARSLRHDGKNDMQLKPGETIDEYRVLEIIGNGGFSVVYKAEDTNLLRQVAIKQFYPEVFSEAGTREWFIREARLAASLNHPNIVATYALRERGDELFLVMEYLSGGDLHTLIDENGPLDRSTLLKVMSHVCHALETLHARNIIHRDIKPENILIAQEGQFKLADFGLAHIRQTYAHSLNDAVGPQPGTLLYMSPEQALGEEVTILSDIYSLAVVLYEAMTAHYYLPFDASSEDEQTLTALIAEEPPLLPATHHASVPGELIQPLLRALSKDPNDRPRTAREFLSEIKNAVARSKHSTLSQKRRPLDLTAPALTPRLAQDLYAVRTLRDAEHQPEQALQQLRTIWDTFSGVPEVAAEWGETLVALGQIEEGRNWLMRAVRMKHELPFAQLALADIYRDIDENEDEANDAIVQAICADPDLVYAVLYEDIVAALDDLVTYESFEALFRRAADTQPTAPVLHNWAQVLALSPTNHDDSIATFQAAIDLDPEYGPAYVGLGSLLIELNQLDDAISLLENATYCNFPNLAAGDWHKANTVYRRPHAFLALAVTYAQVGQFENSAIAACTVLDLDPTELEEDGPELLDMYVTAAETWTEQGEHLRAYKFLNQVIPLAANWGRVEIFTLLATTQDKIDVRYRRKRQWEDALDWLKTSIVHIRRPGFDPQKSPPVAD